MGSLSRTERYSGPTRKAKRDRFLADQPNLQRLFTKANPRLRGDPGNPLEGPPYPDARHVDFPPGVYSSTEASCPYCQVKLRLAYVWLPGFRTRWPGGEPELERQTKWFHPNLQTQKECDWKHRPKWEFMQKILSGARV